ncbi:bifunctional Rossmann-like alpha-beta-alpha sandwich fold/Cytoplasmic tRNA 2-thiolation protein 2 [Babesia duncani]|uniref:Bifunctional Rossmann-like alpha-beta-alpha sandwich fold/Cytoplasmic tRNA 2-thiolation protein 2 n=1 Tax=Babesia duncani TaxID=323732 RepID=A0AAD9UPL9_9APIC|nr:bifunctional Rossmann-like alpha-beta-alpha sandwich fold/Cytoplasmic tRNA 2-thiolation protein 2 [Babesia duncani]
MKFTCCNDNTSSGRSLKRAVDTSHNTPILCYKCHDEPATINTRQPACSSCFISVFTRAFTSNLRFKCSMKDQENNNVGIIVNDTVASIALIHLVLDRNKRRFLKVSKGHTVPSTCMMQHMIESDDLKLRLILAFDQGDSGTNEFTQRSIQYIQSISKFMNEMLESENDVSLTKYDHIHIATISNVKIAYIRLCFFIHPNEESCTNECREFIELVVCLCNENIDVKAFLLQLLKQYNIRALLRWVPEKVSSILTSETLEQVAENILFATCVGGENKVARIGGFIDTLSIGTNLVHIKRPLITLKSKELVLYHRLHKLPYVYKRDLRNFDKRQSTILGSIHNLLESMEELGNNSLHNIINVTNKLIVCNAKNSKNCLVCFGATDNDDNVEPYCKMCRYFASRNSSMPIIFNTLFKYSP